MLGGASSKEHNEGEGAAVRQAHLIAVVAFLFGCAFLLIGVGCSGVRSESPREGQGHTEATKQEQGRSPEATASEETRCGGTRSLEGRSTPAQRKPREPYLTNDVPGCPNGGMLSGTDGKDRLYGGDGADEVRGLGATDDVYGGLGEDVIYGGPGDDIVWGSTIAVVETGRDKSDDVLYGGPGNDLMIDDGGDSVFYGGGGDDEIYVGEGDVGYGGDGNDFIEVGGAGQAKLYCGEGKDFYVANEDDHVSSSCEEEAEVTVMY
jgi:hypothetical protein